MVDLAIWLAAALFVGIMAVCGFILGCARVGSLSGGSVSAEDRRVPGRRSRSTGRDTGGAERKGVLMVDLAIWLAATLFVVSLGVSGAVWLVWVVIETLKGMWEDVRKNVLTFIGLGVLVVVAALVMSIG